MSDQKYGYRKRFRNQGSSSSSSSSGSYVRPFRRAPRLFKSLVSAKAVRQPKSFKEIINYGDVELKNGLTATSGVVFITGAMLGNFSPLSSAFDTYTIRRYKVDFVPYGNQVYNTAAAVNGLPSTSGVSPLYTVVDFDDSNTFASVNAACEYATVKYAMTGKQHTRYVTPKVPVQLYESSITSGYSSKTNQWIDVATDDVPHLGLKWIVTYPAPASNILMYKIVVTVWYAMKDQR